jgi:hypothetical protein
LKPTINLLPVVAMKISDLLMKPTSGLMMSISNPGMIIDLIEDFTASMQPDVSHLKTISNLFLLSAVFAETCSGFLESGFWCLALFLL